MLLRIFLFGLRLLLEVSCVSVNQSFLLVISASIFQSLFSFTRYIGSYLILALLFRNLPVRFS